MTDVRHVVVSRQTPPVRLAPRGHVAKDVQHLGVSRQTPSAQLLCGGLWRGASDLSSFVARPPWGGLRRGGVWRGASSISSFLARPLRCRLLYRVVWRDASSMSSSLTMLLHGRGACRRSCDRTARDCQKSRVKVWRMTRGQRRRARCLRPARQGPGGRTAPLVVSGGGGLGSRPPAGRWGDSASRSSAG